MTQSNQPIVNPQEIVTTLRRHALLWIAPTVVMTVTALAYAMMRDDTWMASQSLLVREETGGESRHQGRFDSVEAMKTAQETISEMSRNDSVLQATLVQVGPVNKSRSKTKWPSESDVVSLQGAIAVKAPNGGKFGHTEVIYLTTKAKTRQRALDINRALCHQLDEQMKKLRHTKAASMMAELEKSLLLAQSDLNAATAKLEALETDVGSDLGELRILNESAGGDSNLRSSLNQIKNEVRQASGQRQEHQELMKILIAANQNAEKLVATPNRLLQTQPALQRLKDGLVDAQLKTAAMLGRMSETHPEVLAAKAEESRVRQHLRDELKSAIHGVRADLKMTDAQVHSLVIQEQKVTAKLDRLATLRARYGNLVTEVQSCKEVTQASQKNLADARARQSAARSASLLTRLDEPVTGDSPVGPGRKTIVLAGMVGGLLAGLGLVFLTVPIGGGKGRRLSDYFRGGRRSEDASRTAGENNSDGRRAASRAIGNREGDTVAIEPTRASREKEQAPPDRSTAQRAGERRGGDRRQDERRETPTDTAS